MSRITNIWSSDVKFLICTRLLLISLEYDKWILYGTCVKLKLWEVTHIFVEFLAIGFALLLALKLLVTDLARGAYHLSNLTILDSSLKFCSDSSEPNSCYLVCNCGLMMKTFSYLKKEGWPFRVTRSTVTLGPMVNAHLVSGSIDWEGQQASSSDLR